MKVILLQYIKGIGEKGEIHEVSDGYAQNSLIPRGLVKVATSTEVNKLEQAKKAKKMKDNREEEQVLMTLMALNGKMVTCIEKLNEKGTLYHALGVKDVIRMVHEQLKLKTTPNLYTEKYALKESGDHQIILEGHGERAVLTVTIQGK